MAQTSSGTLFYQVSYCGTDIFWNIILTEVVTVTHVVTSVSNSDTYVIASVSYSDTYSVTSVSNSDIYCYFCQ